MTRTICLLLAITAALTNVSTLAAAGETSDRIMKEKKVTLGVMELEPFVFRQKDGTFAGSDFEIAKAVFSKLGVTNIEAIPVDYASAIPGLKAKRYDAVGSLFIRPDRCKQVVFANPHYQASDGLIVAKGNPKKLASLEDIVAKPDVTVAVTQGGASSKTAQAVGIPSGQLVSLPNITAELAALKAGRVQAIIVDRIGAMGALAAEGEAALELADPFKVPVVDGKPVVNYAGFVFRLDDSDLAASFNKALAEFKKQPGYLDILRKYHMGEKEMPADDVKSADLCRS